MRTIGIKNLKKAARNKGRVAAYAAVFFLLPALFVGPRPAGAWETAPFYTRHMNPLVQVFGLPPAEDGTLTPAGQVDARLVLDIANNFNQGKDSFEYLNLDGETYRTALVFRYGVSRKVEVGLDIPYIAHTGGIFDGFIADFHNFFHFTNRRRNQVKNDQLDYRYIRNGTTRIDIEQSTSGLGDIMASLGLQLYREPGAQRRAAALRLEIKLPTGDSDRLLGSGGTDFALSLAGTDAASLAAWEVTLFGQIGGLWITNSAILKDMSRHFVGFGTLGFGWTPLSWLALKTQLDVHTPFFHHTQINALGPWATQVDVGFTFALRKNTSFDLGISEPIMVETAPDVDFHLALRQRF